MNERQRTAREDTDQGKEPGEAKEEQPKSEEPTLENASADELLSRLNSDPQRGLTDEEAAKRREKYGPNSLEEEEQSVWKLVLTHFWGPIPWMIEAAVVLSAIARRWDDFLVITTMLLINGGVGFWHQNKSQSAIKALKERLSPTARVIRNGQSKKVDASELVPGDIIGISIGQVAPADAVLLNRQHLSMDESTLTGESLPLEKNGDDPIFSGTSVKRGSARAVVTATGAGTRFARTAELVQKAERISHFQRAVLRIGYFLIGTTGVLVALVIFVTWLLQGNTWDQVLIFALALTLAGIPQALPAVLSVTMSVGASFLAKREAIVSELAAMEEIAGLEVLCADKTGTITMNQLRLQPPVRLAAANDQELLLAAALTCEKDSDDPIDKAILEGLDQEVREQTEKYRIAEFRPFDPTRKRAEADVTNGAEFTVAKGAPQVIMDLVGDETKRQKVEQLVDNLAEDGFRALGVARRDSGKDWRYLGILPLLDPPRQGTSEVVREAQNHGIEIRMVTGDHPAIARQVAKQVGLGTNIIAAANMFGAGRGQGPRVREGVFEANGFAEVTPEDKFNIIKSFQARDRIVGMTGDGVNDAPALKQADVGIAVAGATDAARAASSLVLTAPGLGVIIQAVEQARKIFERMVSYSTFRIAETMRVLLFVSITILVYGFFPVTPIMIVLLAILNDIPIMTIAWDNAPASRRPVRWNMPRVLTIASVLSVTGVLGTFILLWYIQNRMNVSMAELQTAMFLKLLVAGHFTIYLTRNERWPWSRPWPNARMLLALESTQVGGTLIAIFGFLVTPISWQFALGIWAFALAEVLTENGVKVLTYRLLDVWSAKQQQKKIARDREAPLPAQEEAKRFEALEESLEETRAMLRQLTAQQSQGDSARRRSKS